MSEKQANPALNSVMGRTDSVVSQTPHKDQRRNLDWLNASWGYGFGYGMVVASLVSLAADPFLSSQPDNVAVHAESAGGNSRIVSVKLETPIPPPSRNPAFAQPKTSDAPRPDEGGAKAQPADVRPIASVAQAAEPALKDVEAANDSLPLSAHEDDADDVEVEPVHAKPPRKLADPAHGQAHAEMTPPVKKEARRGTSGAATSPDRIADNDISRAIAALFPDHPQQDVDSEKNDTPSARTAQKSQPEKKRVPVSAGPIPGWSLSALSGDRAVLTNASGDSRVVRAGDMIGKVRILKVDPQSAKVETTNGSLVASVQ